MNGKLEVVSLFDSMKVNRVFNLPTNQHTAPA